jgi:signal transduction histidine kinase
MIGDEFGEGERQPNPERVQTDESLRVEREKVDDAIVETFSALEELADAVIEKARGRADAIVAAARATAARLRERAPDTTSSRGGHFQNRAHEDELLREERSNADEAIRAGRAWQSAHLSELRRETDEHLLEERARADEALATRDDFLGIVGHDLRNMLASVMGAAALIAKAESTENPADTVRTCAQRIQRSGARMNRLIGDLLDVASIEAGALAVNCDIGNPADVVLEAVDAFHAQATACEIALTAEVIQPLPLVPFDAARIFQVLANLLSNALKFTPRKGDIVVRVERIDDEIRIGVHDTGEGIAPDKLEQIFERYHQLDSNDRRGVGLGLYISKSIVQGHRGRIWAQSELGEGSTFYFTLPIPRADSEHLADVDVEPDVVIGR